MKTNKIFFMIGFFREIIQTALFAYSSINILPTQNIWPGQNITFLLMLTAGHLIIPAAYLALFYDDTKFYSLIQLLSLLKILRIIMAFLLTLAEILKGHNLLIELGNFSIRGRIFVFTLIILFFDLIFLYFLLLFKEESQKDIQQEKTTHFKVFEETEVKNDLFKGEHNDNPSDSQR